MSIRRKEEIQSDALRSILNEGTPAASGKKKTRGGSSVVDALSEGDIEVDVGLASAINSEFNPEQMKAERAARVAEIKSQVKSGTYRAPSSKELALKFVEELAYEIADGKKLKERDE